MVMITVKTSHHHIWDPDRVAVDIIKEMIETGSANVFMNNEGPCGDSIQLYKMLDYICEKFSFDKSKITIHTINFEENHHEYVICKKKQHWISSTKRAFQNLSFTPNKKVNKNLFGLIYNVPNWDRLCLSSYVHRSTRNQSLIFCNGSWEPYRYNSFYLNSVTEYCAEEIYNIVDFLKSNPRPALDDSYEKPLTAESMLRVVKYYNDFFIDIVAETYSHGATFFITEKTLRPILTLTPFIHYGPKGFLSTLKSDYGFKTFDRWWDESYDDLQNYDRIRKIYQVIDYLDSLSIAEREKMYEEMMPTLLHNYNCLINHE